MIRRTPLPPRKKRLPRSTKPIPKQGNPKRRKAREKRTRDLHRTPEYLAVRAEAMERAKNQCEFTVDVQMMDVSWTVRCPITAKMEPLDAHLMSYGAVGKIKASRIKICCRRHHMLIESQLRPQNRNRLGSKASA